MKSTPDELRSRIDARLEVTRAARQNGIEREAEQRARDQLGQGLGVVVPGR